MDYAKYAYLKINELQATSSVLQAETETSINSAIEFSSPLLNMVITSASDIDCGEVNFFGDVYLQDKLILSATTQGTVQLEILIGGVSVLTEERKVNVGENQFILMKQYSPTKSGKATLAIRIKIVSSNFACTATYNNLAVWGNLKQISNSLSVEMRALETKNGNAIISYQENNNIYALSTALSPQSLSPDDFKLVSSGISHCFATNKSGKIYFFRVDASGGLYYSEYADVLVETKIDTGVSCVFARLCPSSFDEDILLCYIRNGRPVYRTITGENISSVSKFDVPSGQYINIEIVDAPNAARMFVVCTHVNLSNYILLSGEETDLTKFVESIAGKYTLRVTRYVSLEKYQKQMVSTLAADFKMNVRRHLLKYEEMLQNLVAESIKASINLSGEAYEIESTPSINYRLVINQLLPCDSDTEQVVTYEGDCADYTPSETILNSSKKTVTVVDNGWLEKWPFNEIKPCLMTHDGKVIGYLDINDYSKFVDGTDADITNTEYDVMVEFPKIYYNLKFDTDGNFDSQTSTKSTIYVDISNTYHPGYVCHMHTRQGKQYDKVYISAYETNVTEDEILGCSGIVAKTTVDHKYLMEHIGTIRDSQYTLLNYHFATYLQLLYILYYKKLQVRSTLRAGYYDSSKTKTRYSGTANAKGLNCYNYSNTAVTEKTFGLEHIIGGGYKILDGLHFSNEQDYYVIDNTNPDCVPNTEAENYKCFHLEADTTNENVKSQYWGYIAMMSADNDYGFLPVQLFYGVSYYYTNYYGSYARFSKPSILSNYNADSYPKGLCSLCDGSGNIGSPFSVQSANYFVEQSVACTERLMCYPIDKLSK